MDTETLKPFEVLKNSNERLVLDSIGGTTYNHDEPDNLNMLCYFTPTWKDLKYKHNFFWKRDIDNQVRVTIPVGYLPSLHIGQHFQSGRRLNEKLWPKYEKILIELDTKNDLINELTLSNLKLSSQTNFISSHYMDEIGYSSVKSFNGSLQYSTLPNILDTTRNPTSIPIILPAIELIRFYHSNSNFSCRQIFSSAYSNERFHIDVINSLHDGPHTGITKNKYSRFVYRHGYKKDVDHIFLARMLFDNSGIALMAAQRVHNSITKDLINRTYGEVGYPKTNFPFEEKTQLILSGRRILDNSKQGYFFLVHRIHSCSAQLPFRNLSYCSEISPGGKPAPDDANTAFKNNYRYHGPANDADYFGDSVGNQSPDANARHINTVIGERTFIDLKNVNDTYEKLRDSTYKSAQKTEIRKEILVNTSTGKGTSGESNSVPQNISEENLKLAEITDELRSIIKIITNLQKRQPNWEINSICINWCHKKNVIYSTFPQVPCPVKKSLYHQFSYMDKDKNILRLLICYEIKINNQFLYLFETQRRLKDIKSKNNKSPYKEILPMLLVSKHNYSKCECHDFQSFIRSTIRNKSWSKRNCFSQFKQHHIHHSLNNIDNMTSKIQKLILKIIHE